MTTEQEGTAQIMTLQETAHFLRVHYATLLRWLRQGEFPCAFKVASAWRVERGALLAWMRSGRTASPNRGAQDGAR